MTLYYDQKIKEYTDAGIRRYKGLDPHEELDAPTERYGLDPHEWTGTLADKVTAILGKNTPEKETHVNALLCDAAKSFMKNAKYAEMNAHNDETTFKKVMSVNGDDLRAAMSEASLGGILINDEAMDAIKRVEKRYLSYWSFDFGFDSLTHAYDELYKLNDARAHFRESAQAMRGAANTPAISNPEFDRFAPPQGSRVTTVPPPVRTVGSARSAQSAQPAPSVPPIPQSPKTPGSQVRTGGPVRVGNVAKDWLASHGRDEKGRPLASVPASGQSGPQVPAQRSGSIQASLPGSGVTVGRSTPRVPPTARRMGAPEPQVQTPSVDDGFEL